MSSSLDSSSGWWLIAAVQAADEQHPGGDARGRDEHRVVAGAGDELRRARRRGAQGLERGAAHRDGVEAPGRLEADLGDQRVELRRARRERASTETVTRAGTTLAAFGSTSIAPTVATAP